MTLLRPDLRGYAYLRIPGLGGKRVATEKTTDRITDLTAFKGTGVGPGAFKGAIIYSPNASAAGQIRQAGLTNAGSLLQTGENWTPADQLDLNYELIYLGHPYIINERIREVPHIIYAEAEVPLTLWPDGDFAAEDVLSWNNGAIVAPTKSGSFKFIGNRRSLIVTGGSGNLYAQSEDVAVEPGDQLFHAGIGTLAMSSSGSLTYSIIDRTGSVDGSALYSNTFASYRDNIIKSTLTIPAGVLKVALRLGVSANGVTSIWKALPSHFVGKSTTNVQSWLREKRNLMSFSYADYGRSTGTDRWDALDRRWNSLAPNTEFDLLPFVPASSFYTLQLKSDRVLDAHDYWIRGLRPLSEIQDEIDNETAGTDHDQEHILTALVMLICQDLEGEIYETKAREMAAKLEAYRFSTPVTQAEPERGLQRIGLRR